MCAEDCTCNLTIPRGAPGPQGEPGVTPTISVSGTVLPAGSTPTVTRSGSNLFPNFEFGLVPGPQGPPGTGAPGADGQPSFTNLSLAFVQPSVGSATTISTTGSFRWASAGAPIFIQGGGKYTVLATPVAPFTTMQVRNDGGTGNTPPGITVSPTGSPSQVAPTGRDGAQGISGSDGLPGPAGAAAFIPVVNTIPTAAPLPGRGFTIYTDSATNPTVITGYSWNGSSWVASVNLTPRPGTQTIFVNGDPNVVLPAGPVGTIAIRVDQVSRLDYYIKATVSTWTLQYSITVANTITQTVIAGSNFINDQVLTTTRVVGAKRREVTLPPAGNYKVDLAYAVTDIRTDKPIELDWDATLYNEDATWIVLVENVHGSSIAATYATGKFARNPAVSLPSTIAVGATQAFVMRFNADKTRLIIENTYVVTNV